MTHTTAYGARIHQMTKSSAACQNSTKAQVSAFKPSLQSGACEFVTGHQALKDRDGFKGIYDRLGVEVGHADVTDPGEVSFFKDCQPFKGQQG